MAQKFIAEFNRLYNKRIRKDAKEGRRKSGVIATEYHMAFPRKERGEFDKEVSSLKNNTT